MTLCIFGHISVFKPTSIFRPVVCGYDLVFGENLKVLSKYLIIIPAGVNSPPSLPVIIKWDQLVIFQGPNRDFLVLIQITPHGFSG